LRERRKRKRKEKEKSKTRGAGRLNLSCENYQLSVGYENNNKNNRHYIPSMKHQAVMILKLFYNKQ
jgi:hypothetical protein